MKLQYKGEHGKIPGVVYDEVYEASICTISPYVFVLVDTGVGYSANKPYPSLRELLEDWQEV